MFCLYVAKKQLVSYTKGCLPAASNMSFSRRFAPSYTHNGCFTEGFFSQKLLEKLRWSIQQSPANNHFRIFPPIFLYFPQTKCHTLGINPPFSSIFMVGRTHRYVTETWDLAMFHCVVSEQRQADPSDSGKARRSDDHILCDFRALQISGVLWGCAGPQGLNSMVTGLLIFTTSASTIADRDVVHKMVPSLTCCKARDSRRIAFARFQVGTRMNSTTNRWRLIKT